MNETQKIPWKRISVEAAAIVASILLAFAIDAWWAEKLERTAEREELSRLYDEFKSNHDRLSLWISERGIVYRQREAAVELSKTLGAALKDGSETVSLPDRQIAAIIRTPTFEARMSVFDGLVRSGRVEIIENRGIVKAMADWEGKLRSANDEEQRALRFVSDQLFPALATNNDIQHIIPIWNQVDPNSVELSRVTEIHVDLLLVNLAAQRKSQIQIIHYWLTNIRDEAAQIMLEIANSIDKL